MAKVCLLGQSLQDIPTRGELQLLRPVSLPYSIPHFCLLHVSVTIKSHNGVMPIYIKKSSCENVSTRGRLAPKFNTRIKLPANIRGEKKRKKKCNYCDDVIRLYKREKVLYRRPNGGYTLRPFPDSTQERHSFFRRDRDNTVETYTRGGCGNKERAFLEGCIIGNAYRPCGPICFIYTVVPTRYPAPQCRTWLFLYIH